ncbi:hypothetical protein [Streptomyces canus]|uniref:hypothetical protein n=1 Tax=Streptomyces canus TaxID=58343 RepID=UPI002DDA4140|nr:hypothetical protein [Streptomyces canus]WSD82887.1 hypothetical protein OG925_00270 [Streptomyces canus]WSD91947.1 hypothetical protein OG925_50210 [Streptomyces canus]WSD92564.1 hypothetical protein OG925_50750 [Streptomyces canus]
MQHSSGITRAAKRAAAVVVAAVLMSGCSSDDPAQAKERQRDYCTKLGSWQDAAHATTTGEADADAGDGQRVQSPEFDNTESAGHAVIEASKRLDRAGPEHGGTDILDDTVNAVGGDIGAEGRAVSYCDSSGFETLVSSAG